MGFNSLADLAPWLAAEWDHQAADQSFTPWTVGAGSGRMGHWICPEMHHYDASFYNRAGQGSGCPFCAHTRPLPGSTDLATTHPKLAQLWDPLAGNTKTPTEVSAGSEVRLGWRCPEGHAFMRTPLKLVQTSGCCPVCRGSLVVPGVNDLVTLRPDIARQWNFHRNGELLPDHLHPRSNRRVWWTCPNGHEFQMIIIYRCKAETPTCPVETGRRFLRGASDLATKEPRLALDWNQDRNGCAAHDVLAGGAAKRWWTCSSGHNVQQTVMARRRSGGCVKCAPNLRVAPPKSSH